MRRIGGAILVLVLSGVASPLPAAAAEPLRHDLTVRLLPDRHALFAEDEVTFPDRFLSPNDPRVRFLLHAGLSPEPVTPGVRIEPEGEAGGDPPMASYALILPPGSRSARIRYGGVIDHPVRPVGRESARGQRDTPGAIGLDGVYLVGRSGWVPRFDGERLSTFRLAVDLPPGWGAVSQGMRELHRSGEEGVRDVWNSEVPQEEIDLAAGRYVEYLRDAGGAEAMVFLRERDDDLAARYLDATARYLSFYGDLIGPYPFPKFALVENFWESGYGMPEFTLLGPSVLRLPFLVESSYPHEILHSWWGNGVYVDASGGNWAEGLTAYLADHLLKEKGGTGAEYRLTTLQKYSDYVLEGRDLPLSAFRNRHGSVTEAVGYGKSLMLFHMLRREMGDDRFVEGLRTLYREYRFRAAGFAEVRRAFEQAAGRDLADRFDPWIDRAGAPALAVRDLLVEREGESYRLRADLLQTQEGDPFPIRVPVAVTLEGREAAVEAIVPMREKSVRVNLALSARPLRFDLDPEFDLFRRLDRRETPAALSQAFGTKKVLILLPSQASPESRRAYRNLAESLSRTGPGGEVEIGDDADRCCLPIDRSVWLLGWENRLRGEIDRALVPTGASVTADSVRIGEATYPRTGHPAALAVRHPDNPELALLWIGADDPWAVPGLARKLPHYHKYSYLVFEGVEPVNIARGRWTVSDSPMTVHLPGEDGELSRVPRASLSPRVALSPPAPPEPPADAPPLLSGEEK
ncbi:MAG: M1 family aminopeptidase [Deltaproteobacteria bacterium]